MEPDVVDIKVGLALAQGSLSSGAHCQCSQLGMTGPKMRPLIDAHRGECGIPDLPAAERYSRAIALGVDFVEVDIRCTRDGVFFNYHDNRTPSGLAVRDLSYTMLERELGAELDA
jgi:glycerophosphoryl diester phosphodiesterase